MQLGSLAMKWVTRDYVHLDRVASPWLIKRFVDVDAQFVFVPWGKESTRPPDAIPFGLPGVELGPYDDNGSTFQKILAKYHLTDPALQRLGRVISAGVRHAVQGYKPAADEVDGQIAVGLLNVSDGMMLVKDKDDEILDASLIVYDALYTSFKAYGLLSAQNKSLPSADGKGPTNKTNFLRGILKGDV